MNEKFRTMKLIALFILPLILLFPGCDEHEKTGLSFNNNNDRYVIYSLSKADQLVLLDKQTGRAWRYGLLIGSPDAWVPMTFVDVNGDPSGLYPLSKDILKKTIK